MIAFDVPVDPDGEQGRQWIIQELAKPEYQAAQPSWFDRIAQAFWNWLTSLDLSGGGGAQGPLLVVLITVIVAVVIVAFLIFGLPRLNRKAAQTGALLEDDRRTAAQLRESAATAAARSDWPVAIEELFRAVALSLMERGLVHTSPGTTALQFSRSAGSTFPGFAARLTDCGELFDAVRYLDQPGSQADYERLAQLELELRSASVRVDAPA